MDMFRLLIPILMGHYRVSMGRTGILVRIMMEALLAPTSRVHAERSRELRTPITTLTLSRQRWETSLVLIAIRGPEISYSRRDARRHQHLRRELTATDTDHER